MKKFIAALILLTMILTCTCVSVFAEEGDIAPAPGESEVVPVPVEDPAVKENRSFFTGAGLTVLAIAFATILPGIGSAYGVRLLGQATNGLLAENPTMFGKALVLEVLPMTQGIYGLVTSFMIMTQTGILGGDLVFNELTVKQGACFLLAALPIAIVGLISAIYQAKSAASGIQLIGKRSDKVGPAITSAALVETYAIFALLISILAVVNFGAAFGA